LSKKELLSFSKAITDTLDAPFPPPDACNSNTCKSIVLHTPLPQVSFAINYAELLAIEDLVKVTLFEMNLKCLLSGVL
jgi:hypothetical protein